VTAGVDGLGEDVAVMRDDHRDAGPDRALADDQRPIAPDDRRVTDADAGHVGDRVVRPGPATTDDDPEIPCAHWALLR
jgi:hypothetical protein